MNSTKIKKTLIKLLPYIIVGLVCTNLGEAWRLAEGADMGKKMLSFFSMVGVAAGTALSTSEVDTADPTKYNMILSIAEGDYTYSRMADRSLRSSEVPLADLRYPAGGVNGGQDVLTAVQLSLITRRWVTITLFAGRSG